MDLQTKIANESEFFKNEKLELNPSFAKTQPALLKLLDYYYSSKFTGSDFDNNGDKKPFINKVDTPTIVAAKQTDIDVKNFHFIAEDSGDYRRTWLMEKQFRIWVKDNAFSKLLNKMVWNLPKYGSIMVKKVGDAISHIPLRNIILDPTMTSTSAPIIEKHRMSLSEFESEAKERGWENYEKVIEEKREKKENFVEVWERHAEYEDGSNFKIAVVDTNKKGSMVVTEIASGNLKDFAYRSHNMEDVYGRWLGRGIGEKLLETQIAANETEYYFRKGLKWTSLRIFQSRDNSLAKNVLNAVENGDILQVLSEIQPVATEERNLSAFNYSDQKWDVHGRNRSFSADIVAGQRPAAGVPYSTSALQARMSGNYFGFIQENLAIFLKGLLKDWVIPKFKNERTQEILINEMGDEDIQILRKLIADEEYRKKRIEHIRKTGNIPTLYEANMLREISKKLAKNKRGLQLPKSIYDNLSYNMTIDITGEMIDTQSRIAAAQMLISIIGSNPTVMNDPRTSRAISKILDWAGVNPTGLLDIGEEPEADITPLARGGSVAAPRTAGATAINTQTTI